MITKIIGFFGLGKTLLITLILGIIIGIIPGCQMGGVGSYRKGYNDGYTDGKTDVRKKVFPNIWRFLRVTPDECEEGSCPNAN